MVRVLQTECLLCSSHSAVHIAAVMRRRLQQSSAGVSEEDGRGEDGEERGRGKERERKGERQGRI